MGSHHDLIVDGARRRRFLLRALPRKPMHMVVQPDYTTLVYNSLRVGGIHVVLQSLPPSHGTIACLIGPTALTDVVGPWQVHGDSISFNVTEPFPFIWPWHCVVLAPVVAARNRYHAGGWDIVHEASRLATCPPLLLHSPRPFVCSSVGKTTALCGSSSMHMVANVPLGA